MTPDELAELDAPRLLMEHCLRAEPPLSWSVRTDVEGGIPYYTVTVWRPDRPRQAVIGCCHSLAVAVAVAVTKAG